MKKMFLTSLVALATTSGFVLKGQPAPAHCPYYYPPLYFGYPFRYCYPVTQWFVKQDPAYHPQAYADGYRQGRESAKKGKVYKPRTAGGEFARGFEDGYYGRAFTGQKQVVPNEYRPYTTTECDWF
jgi:hypothetical protein